MIKPIPPPRALTREALRPVAERIIAAGGNWHDVAEAMGNTEQRCRVMGNKLGIFIKKGRPKTWTDERVKRAATLAVRTTIANAAAVEGVTLSALISIFRKRDISVSRLRQRIGGRVK